MTYRVRNIALAVGLALIAALLTTFYVANYKRHVQQTEKNVKVWVATRDIPAGTPGAELVKHGWIGTAEVVSRTVVPGAISSPEEVATRLTRQDIFTGEQVSLRRFASQAELGVRSQLRGTLRALSLPGTSDQLLAGILRDGDHVDVIANFDTGEGVGAFTRVIARDVLVLRTGTPPVGSKVTAEQSSVVLALHDSREAQKVFFTVQNAHGWSLQLRPVAHVIDSPEDVEGMPSLHKDGATLKALEHSMNGVTK